jgi:hypothetical protein
MCLVTNKSPVGPVTHHHSLGSFTFGPPGENGKEHPSKKPLDGRQTTLTISGRL